MNDAEPDARIRFLLKLPLLVGFPCRAAALPGKSLAGVTVFIMLSGWIVAITTTAGSTTKTTRGRRTFTRDLRQIDDGDQLSIVVIVVPEENGSITRQRNTLN